MYGVTIQRFFVSAVKIENIQLKYFGIITSTHNLCFGAKIRKKYVYPCIPQVCYIKVGFKGVYITKTCFRV